MSERAKLGKAQDVKSWDKVLSLLMEESLSFPLFIVSGLNTLDFILIVTGYTFAEWAFTENHFFSTVVRIQKD